MRIQMPNAAPEANTGHGGLLAARNLTRRMFGEGVFGRKNLAGVLDGMRVWREENLAEKLLAREVFGGRKACVKES